ncbi:MAG: type II toxin-antitoxin system VapC family toxin [Acidobacteriaceae bacterium]
MTVLIDSDVLIEILRGRDAELFDRWLELSDSEAIAMVSPVSFAEIWAGARPQEHAAIGALFRSLTCASIDEAIGRRAGDLLREYAGSHSVKLADAMIAASAMHYRAALWTRNRKHFPMPEIEFH